MKTLQKKSLFWDVGSVDPHKNADFVIERILALGDEKDFGWAFENYGAQKIKKGLLKSKNLNRKSLSFWCNFFDIEPAQCKKIRSANKSSAFSKR